MSLSPPPALSHRQLLALLTDEAASSPIVRDLMEACLLRQAALRSFAFKNRQSKKERKAAEVAEKAQKVRYGTRPNVHACDERCVLSIL